MAIIRSQGLNITVADLTARDAISPKQDGLTATVLDTTGDAVAGTGIGTYKWSSSLNNWLLLADDDAISFTESYKTKLEGIEDNATADMTKAEIDALGIDAATVNSHFVHKDVPVEAVFTDTVYDDTAVQSRLSSLENAGYITNYIVTASDVIAQQGAISITESQISDLKSYALSSHTHTIYALTTHEHANYALTSHDHAGVYALETHSHDNYSLLTHNHDDTYSLLTHNHDAEYSLLTHDHSGTYALEAHDHDGTYEPVDSTILRTSDIGTTIPAMSNVYVASVGDAFALDYGNGNIQVLTLTENATWTDSVAEGETLTLLIASPSYILTWPTITWFEGIAPTMPATGYAVVAVMKANGTLFGNYVGDA